MTEPAEVLKQLLEKFKEEEKEKPKEKMPDEKPTDKPKEKSEEKKEQKPKKKSSKTVFTQRQELQFDQGKKRTELRNLYKKVAAGSTFEERKKLAKKMLPDMVELVQHIISIRQNKPYALKSKSKRAQINESELRMLNDQINSVVETGKYNNRMTKKEVSILEEQAEIDDKKEVKLNDLVKA